MGKEKVREVLTHPQFRMAILTVRARYLTASENPVSRAAGLCGIMVHNLLSRKLIRLCLERTLFHDRRQAPPFAGSDGLPTRRVHLSPANFREALLASGSMPPGHARRPQHPQGAIRLFLDGGIVDYHLHLPYNLDSRSIVLIHRPHHPRMDG